MTEEKPKTNKDRLENIEQAIYERLAQIEQINKEKIKNFEQVEDEMYDALHEQIDNEVIYYADQDEIIAEYGIRDAIYDWNESEYSDMTLDVGTLAYFLLEKMFTEKQSMQFLFIEYVENFERGDIE